MVRYDLIHDDRVVHTLTSEYADADILMINLMLELSDDTPGELSLWSVEVDPETGVEKHTWVASTMNGVKI